MDSKSMQPGATPGLSSNLVSRITLFCEMVVPIVSIFPIILRNIDLILIVQPDRYVTGIHSTLAKETPASKGEIDTLPTVSNSAKRQQLFSLRCLKKEAIRACEKIENVIQKCNKNIRLMNF